MRSAASRKLVAAASASGIATLAAVAVPPVGHAGGRSPAGGAPPSYGVDIQAVYDRAGNPSLVAVQRGRVLVARVRCAARCHVWLQVDDQRTGSGARVAVHRSALVGVARKHLRRGGLHVLIYVDSGPLVQGRTELS